MPGVWSPLCCISSVFFEPIRDLGFRWNNLQMAMAAGEHILEVLDAEVRIQEDPSPVILPRLRGEVEFRHVWFQYQLGVPVLQDFSCMSRLARAWLLSATPVRARPRWST